METMTEEEAFALDEYYTKNPPKVDPSKARIRITYCISFAITISS